MERCCFGDDLAVDRQTQSRSLFFPPRPHVFRSQTQQVAMPDIAVFMLPWITFAAVLSGGQTAGQGGPISCECTTSQCAQQKTSVCTTEGLCFTQYLDRGLESPSLLRGCTEGRTPLLCENRKPSRAKNWPLLHCCDTDFCNRDAVPTPPNRNTEELVANGQTYKNLEISKVVTNHSGNEFSPMAPDSSPSSLLASVQKSPWTHIFSPVYLSVLVLGVVSLVIIGIVAATVIRRSNRFYAEHYGALEFQRGKTDHVHCDCDSEIESVGSSQPYLHMVCPNRNT